MEPFSGLARLGQRVPLAGTTRLRGGTEQRRETVKTSIITLGALLVGSALMGAAPAKAAVAVSVGVAAPAEECVTYRQHPHRIVARYSYCNEPVWSGDPIVVEGVTYRENLHYRMHEGHR